jgi:hypothetical protein
VPRELDPVAAGQHQSRCAITSVVRPLRGRVNFPPKERSPVLILSPRQPSRGATAAAEQQQRTVEEPWIDVIGSVLREMKGKVLASDAWHILNLVPGHTTQEHNARFGNAMKALGWKRAPMYFKDHGTANGYWRALHSAPDFCTPILVSDQASVFGSEFSSFAQWG